MNCPELSETVHQPHGRRIPRSIEGQVHFHVVGFDLVGEAHRLVDHAKIVGSPGIGGPLSVRLVVLAGQCVSQERSHAFRDATIMPRRLDRSFEMVSAHFVLNGRHQCLFFGTARGKNVRAPASAGRFVLVGTTSTSSDSFSAPLTKTGQGCGPHPQAVLFCAVPCRTVKSGRGIQLGKPHRVVRSRNHLDGDCRRMVCAFRQLSLD